jgi:hypothetical protein
MDFGNGIPASDVSWQANQFGDVTFKIRNDATDAIFVASDVSQKS